MGDADAHFSAEAGAGVGGAAAPPSRRRRRSAAAPRGRRPRHPQQDPRRAPPARLPRGQDDRHVAHDRRGAHRGFGEASCRFSFYPTDAFAPTCTASACAAQRDASQIHLVSSVADADELHGEGEPVEADPGAAELGDGVRGGAHRSHPQHH